MRATDLYVCSCHKCGAEIQSPTREAQCACGMKALLEWPSRIAGGSKPVTITGKYEVKI